MAHLDPNVVYLDDWYNLVYPKGEGNYKLYDWSCKEFELKLIT